MPFSRDLFWLAHVSHIDVTNVNLPLHQSIFHFQLSKCSFGALIDRFTFTDQGSWDECDCDGITAIFNFTKDQIQLPDTAVRLDIQFSELIIEPENENGDTFYSIYIYFDSQLYGNQNTKTRKQFSKELFVSKDKIIAT